MNTFVVDNGNKHTEHARIADDATRQICSDVCQLVQVQPSEITLESDAGTSAKFTVQNTRAAVFNPTNHGGYYIYHLL